MTTVVLPHPIYSTECRTLIFDKQQNYVDVYLRSLDMKKKNFIESRPITKDVDQWEKCIDECRKNIRVVLVIGRLTIESECDGNVLFIIDGKFVDHDVAFEEFLEFTVFPSNDVYCYK